MIIKITAVVTRLEYKRERTLINPKKNQQLLFGIDIDYEVANVGANSMSLQDSNASTDADKMRWGCDITKGDGHGFNDAATSRLGRAGASAWGHAGCQS
jgi:hypothetical protein